MFMAVDLPEPLTPRSNSRPPAKCKVSSLYWYTLMMPARCSIQRSAMTPRLEKPPCRPRNRVSEADHPRCTKGLSTKGLMAQERPGEPAEEPLVQPGGMAI